MMRTKEGESHRPDTWAVHEPEHTGHNSTGATVVMLAAVARLTRRML